MPIYINQKNITMSVEERFKKLEETQKELFFLSASILFSCDVDETKTHLEEMMIRFKNDHLDLGELSPRIKKVFVFYCENYRLIFV